MSHGGIAPKCRTLLTDAVKRAKLCKAFAESRAANDLAIDGRRADRDRVLVSGSVYTAGTVPGRRNGGENVREKSAQRDRAYPTENVSLMLIIELR